MIDSGRDFVGYEYKELTVPSGKLPFYLDSYENFGWAVDENAPRRALCGAVSLTLKRDRRIVNKAELTRLQRNFEACAADLEILERAKTAGANFWALAVGLAGTALMACPVFAVTAEPPLLLPCVLLAVPAFLGWFAAPLLYRRLVVRGAAKTAPLIEEKQEEIYSICQRGHQLLPQ